MREISEDDWIAEGRARFGDDIMDWKFKCPVCGAVIGVREYEQAGAPENAVGFSCIGRWSAGKGCDYAGGGLFKLNPVRVIGAAGSIRYFDFAGGQANEQHSDQN